MKFFLNRALQKGLFSFLISLLSSYAQSAQSSSNSFPQVVAWKNKPVIVYDSKKSAVLQKKMLLKSPFAVVTNIKDQLEFKINIFDSIVVYPQTKVQILDFLNETGFVSDFYILDGMIRFTSSNRSLGDLEKSTAFVILKTPFFDLKAMGQYDFLISLDMKEPSVTVKMISGILPLEFFAYEKKLNLKAGEQVKFSGVLSADGAGIEYDYLLHQRKVPKGQLSEVSSFDQSLFLKVEKDTKQAELNKKKAAKMKQEALKKKQKEYEDSFLCKKPFGHKDQCAWWSDSGKCFRKRCNASGQWGDLIERPMSPLCSKDFTVSVCDY